MAIRYASGDNIPTVGIQPSASPISLNVLPAAGQPIRGNELQQIAESLAPFNQGLISFLGQGVKVLNTQAQQAGSNIDMTGIDSGLDNTNPAQKADEINKRFKALLQQNGGSDAANPYFQVGAEQNLGRTLASRYRTQMYAMKERLSDPNNPMSYADASKQVAEQVIGDSLANNFYGFSAFRDTVEKYDTEMMAAFNAERVKRIEEQGSLRAEEALSEAAKSGDLVLMNDAMSSYQKVTTDPARHRATWEKAAQAGLKASNTVDEVDRVFDAFSQMNFGTQKVRDNLELYADLVGLKDAALQRIEAKAELNSKAREREYDNATKQFYEQGPVAKIQELLKRGATADEIESTVTSLVNDSAQKNKWSAGTTDRIRQFASTLATSEAGRAKNLDDNTSRAVVAGFTKNVVTGKFKNIEELYTTGTQAGLTLEQLNPLARLWESTTGALPGVARQASDARAADTARTFAEMISGSGMFPTASNGSPGPAAVAEAGFIVNKLSVMLGSDLTAWFSDQAVDSRGRTLSSYQKESGDSAKAATLGYVNERSTAAFSAEREAFEKNVAAGKVLKNGTWIPNPRTQATKSLESDQSPMTSAAKALAAGAGMGQTEVVAALNDMTTRLEEQADIYDIGVFQSAQSPYDIRRAQAMAYFTSMSEEGGRSVITNDSSFSGPLMSIPGGPAVLLGKIFGYYDDVPSFAYGNTESAMGRWTNTFATRRDAKQILADYGATTRMDGISLDEVLAGIDANGMDVWGITLPAREDMAGLTKAAYSVLVIKSAKELEDSAKISAVTQMLGVPAENIEAWKSSQMNLLRLRQEYRRSKEVSPGLGGRGPNDAEMYQSRTKYEAYLEAARRKNQ